MAGTDAERLFSSSHAEFGKADIENINQMFQEFTVTYNAKDATKLVDFFTPGGVVLPPNASTVRGTENVREYYVRRFARGASDLKLEPRDIAGSAPSHSPTVTIR